MSADFTSLSGRHSPLHAPSRRPECAEPLVREDEIAFGILPVLIEVEARRDLDGLGAGLGPDFLGQFFRQECPSASTGF